MFLNELTVEAECVNVALTMGGAQGQASDIEITAREIQKLKKELFDIIAQHSGKPYEEVARDSDRDYWMIAEEAKAYGMIDEVLRREKK
ncbi:MAG: ATP-dependent Clp protease proteolytic subunit [Bacteroidales bacterium]|nr:ATP-dependent Clp protease proteolytic subunit [Bacteroidales bacterium]